MRQFSTTEINYELKEKLIKALGYENQKEYKKQQNIILKKRTHSETLKNLIKHPAIAKVYYHFY